MNKKTKESLISFLSNLLEKSNISEYKYIDLDDNDINFIVIPNINNKKINQNVKLQLIIYCSNEKNLTIYCPLLYKLQDGNSAIYTLNAINEVNNKIALGKIYLNQDNNSIISYINRVLFNNINNELTPEIFNEYIDAFLLCSIEFYKQMKEVMNEKKWI